MIRNEFTFSILFLLLLSFTIFLLEGCTPIEDRIVANQQPVQGTIQPLTAVEWTNKINRILIPLINDGETYISHQLDITKGSFSVEEEIAMVDSTLDKTQEAIEEINSLYQPQEYTQHKADTIARLKAYKEALKNYRGALENKDMEAVKNAANALKNELSALKTVFSVY